MCWAGYLVMARPLLLWFGTLIVNAYSLLFGAAGLLIVAAPSLTQQNWGAVTAAGWAGLIFSGFVAVGLGNFVWLRGVRHLESTRTVLYSNLTPIVAVFLGILFLNESLSPIQGIGIGFVLAGILLARLAANRTMG